MAEMDWERKVKLIWRWSLVTACLIALFWAFWYVVAREIPVIRTIQISEGWIWNLPMGISRWWDVLIGPIWSTATILIFTNKRVKKDWEEGKSKLHHNIWGILATGVFLSLFALQADTGFALSIICSLLFGMVINFFSKIGIAISFSLAYGLFLALSCSLLVGLIGFLCVNLGIVLTLVPSFIASAWPAISKWLLAQN